MQFISLESINWWEGIKIIFDWTFGLTWLFLKLMLSAWPIWLMLFGLYALKLLFLKITANKNAAGTQSSKIVANNSHTPTKYARLLREELYRRGIEAIAEYNDGHKTVDLAILTAKLYIEIDGIQHFTNPDQIITDFERDHYSEREGFYTIRIPNEILRNHLGGITDAIAEIVKRHKD